MVGQEIQTQAHSQRDPKISNEEQRQLMMTVEFLGQLLQEIHFDRHLQCIT